MNFVKSDRGVEIQNDLKKKDGINANKKFDANDPDSWIDVKKDTYTLDNEHIEKLIEETLFGNA